MKKALSLFLLFMASFGYAIAQDVITTRDGKDIQAKIIEVTSDEIKYKKFNNLEGPLFTLKKSEVLIVRYQNGENEVFANEPQKDKKGNAFDGAGIHDRMVFAQYKNLYNPSFYIPEYGDPYSPGWCGLASFLIPGLGQGIAGEWGRGLAFFGAHIAISTPAVLLSSSTDGWSAYVGLALLLANDIYSIVDAVRVAKIKNMYIQDIRKQSAYLDINLYPSFTLAPAETVGSLVPVTGLTLSLSF